MKFIVPACLLFTATVPAAYALTGADLDAANAYFAVHPDIKANASWIYDEVMRKNTLQEANDYLNGNHPADNIHGGYMYLDPISLVSKPSVPMTNIEPTLPSPDPTTDAHTYINTQIAPLKTTLDQDNQDIAQNAAGITQNHNDIAENHHDIVKTEE
ncbi:hypothetical protein WH249_18345, partial [Enterobacter ludwigii]